MNITGPQYSKAVKGLRSPVKGRDFELVYVYPVLVDDSLGGVTESIRDFLSASMLKELFIGNSLNLVSMASQIHPITDEHGNPDKTNELLRTIEQTTSGNKYIEYGNQSQQAARDIEVKIGQKTARIEQFLNSDPKLKALRPYLQTITMDNMIDVPVIVGTKNFSVDTATVALMIIVAISNGMTDPFNNQSTIKQIFNELKQLNTEKGYSVLNTIITQKPETQSRLKNWMSNSWTKIKGRVSATSPGRYINSIVDKTSNSGSVTAIKDLMKSKNISDPLFTIDESLAILNSVQTQLTRTEVMFNLCLDPAAIAKQFGLSVKAGQVSTYFDNIGPNISSVMSQLTSDFILYMDRLGNLMINSMMYAFWFRGSSEDSIMAKKQYIANGLIPAIAQYVENYVKPDLISAMQGDNPSHADAILKKIKELCNKELQDSDKLMSEMINNLNKSSIASVMFDASEVFEYMKVLEKISTSAITQMKDVEYLLKEVLGIKTVSHLNAIEKIIDEHIGLFMNRPGSIPSDITTYAIHDKNTGGNGLGAPGGNGTSYVTHQHIEEVKRQFINATSEGIQFIFLYAFQLALCRFTNVVKASIETAKHSVTTLPNYALVIPVETVLAVAHAFQAKSFRNMLNNIKWTQSGRGGQDDPTLRVMSNLNDNYVKGVVKFISDKLGVPNLFVVDSKGKAIYYKMMYMDTVNKTSLTTMESFVKLVTKKELTPNMSQLNSW